MPVPVGFLEATFIYRHGDAARDCTFAIGYQDTSDPPLSVSDFAQQILLDWEDTGSPGELSNVSSEWLFLGVQGLLMTVDGPVTYLESVTHVGTHSGSPLPLNCSFLVNKNTGLGGRRNRGRSYIPPINPMESDVNGIGVVDSSDVTAQQARWDSFLTTTVLHLLNPYLFHQTGVQTPTQIQTFSFQNRIATQRRRLRR